MPSIQQAALLVLLMTSLCTGCKKQDKLPDQIEPTTKQETPQTFKFEKYVLELSQSTDKHGAIAKFLKNGKSELVKQFDKENSVSVPYVDLKNLSKSASHPNLVIEEHKPDEIYEYDFYTIGDTIKKTQLCSRGSEIDLSAPNWNEINAQEPLGEWGARSNSPKIVLRWKDDKFELNVEAMRKLKPSNEELDLLKSVLNEEFNKYPTYTDDVQNSAPPELAGEVLNLYYSGNADLAKSYYESCWPKGRSGKKAYWDFLLQMMKSSPYWSALKAMNGKDSQ